MKSVGGPSIWAATLGINWKSQCGSEAGLPLQLCRWRGQCALRVSRFEAWQELRSLHQVKCRSDEKSPSQERQRRAEKETDRPCGIGCRECGAERCVHLHVVGLRSPKTPVDLEGVNRSDRRVGREAKLLHYGSGRVFPWHECRGLVSTQAEPYACRNSQA